MERRTAGNVRRRQEFAGPPELAHIASRFQPGREYDEAEVNRTLLVVDHDFATLRRYLVDAGLLRRERGRYRRA